jgi:phospholipid/cholesterol/gamma-HCH transport system substrate-binding protein
MKRSTVEISVGIFVLIGILCVGYLTVKLGKMEWFGEGYYPLNARFTSVTGLKTGTEVQMAGVSVGRVAKIALDPDLKIAVVTLNIRQDLELAEDVIASVKTAGLIGDKYVSLAPGGAMDMLKPGDTIVETESALDIEELVSKYVFGSVE